ncbi:MAG: tetratricopeptide repeat protein [Byssovorax sp.]
MIGRGARLLVGGLVGLGAVGCGGATLAPLPSVATGAPIATPSPEPAAATGSGSRSTQALDLAPPAGADFRRMQAAVAETDAGRFLEAIAALEELRHRYPNNAMVLHELALAYRLSKQPEKAVAMLAPFADRLPVDTQASLASALDDAGRPEQAAALLRVAIARHPRSGLLHSELATTLARTGNLAEALALYLRGVEVEPSFSATYLHLAQLLSESPYPGLTLVHGETFRVLEPGTQRSAEMAVLMAKICRDAVQIETRNGKTETHVSLAPGALVAAPGQGTPLAGAFALKFGPRLVAAHTAGFSLASLHKARSGFLDDLRKPDASFDWSSTPLFRWLGDLAAAGHLEAYDHWLYAPAFSDEAELWSNAHHPAMVAMAEYVSAHPLFPEHR